jgi:hypothetical protein
VRNFGVVWRICTTGDFAAVTPGMTEFLPSWCGSRQWLLKAVHDSVVVAGPSIYYVGEFDKV